MVRAPGRCRSSSRSRTAGSPWSSLAVGETVILLHSPLPLVGVSIVMERGCQQNDSVADGWSSPCRRCSRSRSCARSRSLSAAAAVPSPPPTLYRYRNHHHYHHHHHHHHHRQQQQQQHPVRKKSMRAVRAMQASIVLVAQWWPLRCCAGASRAPTQVPLTASARSRSSSR